LAGGASRALVFSNFPFALAAIALTGFAVAALVADQSRVPLRLRRWVYAVAGIAILLCLVTALPGVVDQGDLDAKLVNALPALGVVLAFALTIAGVRNGAPAAAVPWSRRDSLALVVIAALAILALPWILADVGVYIGDLPLLGRVFMSDEFAPPGATLRAVHLGHHHGLDGFLFITAALVLGRRLGALQPGRLRTAIGWYLALMLAYGVPNFANDFWLEQLEKRGTTEIHIPSMLRPEPTFAWGLLLLGMIVTRYLLFRPRDEDHGLVAEPAGAH